MCDSSFNVALPALTDREMEDLLGRKLAMIAVRRVDGLWEPYPE